jgi:hypothetical protein
MLLNNYSIINCALVGKTTGGTTDLFNKYKPSGFINYMFGEHVYDNPRIVITALPTGTQPPYSIVMGLKGGELSSSTNISGQGLMSSGLTMGKNMEAQLDGSGELTSNLSLIIQMASTLMGTGALSGSMVGTLQMAADLAGSGDLDASMKLISNVAATLIGEGAVSGNLKGKASMSATIYVNQSEASVQQIVDGVWNLEMDGVYTAQDVMKILVAVAAGKTEIVDLGGGSATVVFRNLEDTIDKIEATMADSERTDVIIN